MKAIITKGSNLWLGIVVITVAVILFANINGWQLEDDEGTALYAIWRFAEGEQPYVDFASTKAPLYLFVGRTAVQLLGRNLLLLRLISAVTVLASVSVLALTVKSVWGRSIALLLWSLTLLTPEVYQLARLFRTDSLMLPLFFLALALMVRNIKHRQRLSLIAAGVLFGLAMMFKVVAIMPLLGAAIWLGLRTLQEKRWREGINDIVTLVVPAGMVVITGYALVELWAPGATSLVLGSPGEFEAPLILRLTRGLVGWTLFAVTDNHLLFLTLPMLPIVAWHWQKAEPLLFWLSQIMGSAPFFLISGPPYPRYLAYATPSLIMLLLGGAILLKVKLPRVNQATILIPALVLPLIAVFPDKHMFLNYERDTRALTNWVAEHTDPGEVVVSDYAALNFHAGRRSVPTQGVISRNWAVTELITGKLLIEQMEREQAVMLLLHVPGGSREPNHLYSLSDYDAFRDYLVTNFERIQTWDRAGQLIEIWERRQYLESE